MQGLEAWVLNKGEIKESLSGISALNPTPNGFEIVSGGNTYSFTIPNMHIHSNLVSVLEKLTTDGNGNLFFDGNQLLSGNTDLTSYINSLTNIITATVGVGGISQYKVCYLSASNTVMTASANNITHCNKVLGLVLDTKTEGEQVNIKTGGEVVNNAWNLIQGDSYFLGVGGEVTNVAPLSGFIQKVGIAKNSTTLILKLEQAIKII